MSANSSPGAPAVVSGIDDRRPSGNIYDMGGDAFIGRKNHERSAGNIDFRLAFEALAAIVRACGKDITPRRGQHSGRGRVDAVVIWRGNGKVSAIDVNVFLRLDRFVERRGYRTASSFKIEIGFRGKAFSFGLDAIGAIFDLDAGDLIVFFAIAVKRGRDARILIDPNAGGIIAGGGSCRRGNKREIAFFLSPAQDDGVVGLERDIRRRDG